MQLIYAQFHLMQGYAMSPAYTYLTCDLLTPGTGTGCAVVCICCLQLSE